MTTADVSPERIRRLVALKSFASLMEKKLMDDRCVAKGDWNADDVSSILGRLQYERLELAEAVLGASPKDIAYEAVDVALTAMQVADKCGGLE